VNYFHEFSMGTSIRATTGIPRRFCANSCRWSFCCCTELITDDQFQSLTEITSLANSLPNTIHSRLELLKEVKVYASQYEEAFDAASAALTAAKKQQTDAVSQQQV